MKQLFISILLFAFYCSAAQKGSPQVRLLTKDTKTSIRGLSVVNNVVAWVSGSNGTIGRTTDGGKNWKWLVVNGFEKRDFRDIEAFDGSTAIIMAVDAPAYILKTTDGGNSWKVVYENNTKGMFLDALEFWNERIGVVIGDPIDGRIFMARTSDGGNTWTEVPNDLQPKADSGEALFAASGTNIRAFNRGEAVFVTGGLSSRIFIGNRATKLPLVQGKETTGANSVSVMDPYSEKESKTIIVVGGDFNTPASDSANCFYSTDGGKSWKESQIPPHGYRSCVAYLSKKQVISCGLNGVDYSFDGGKKWRWISKEGYNVCSIAKKGDAIFLAGGNGRIAKIVFPGQRD